MWSVGENHVTKQNTKPQTWSLKGYFMQTVTHHDVQVSSHTDMCISRSRIYDFKGLSSLQLIPYFRHKFRKICADPRPDPIRKDCVKYDLWPDPVLPDPSGPSRRMDPMHPCPTSPWPRRSCMSMAILLFYNFSLRTNHTETSVMKTEASF